MGSRMVIRLTISGSEFPFKKHGPGNFTKSWELFNVTCMVGTVNPLLLTPWPLGFWDSGSGASAFFEEAAWNGDG